MDIPYKHYSGFIAQLTALHGRHIQDRDVKPDWTLTPNTITGYVENVSTMDREHLPGNLVELENFTDNGVDLSFMNYILEGNFGIRTLGSIVAIPLQLISIEEDTVNVVHAVTMVPIDLGPQSEEFLSDLKTIIDTLVHGHLPLDQQQYVSKENKYMLIIANRRLMVVRGVPYIRIPALAHMEFEKAIDAHLNEIKSIDLGRDINIELKHGGKVRIYVNEQDVPYNATNLVKGWKKVVTKSDASAFTLNHMHFDNLLPGTTESMGDAQMQLGKEYPRITLQGLSVVGGGRDQTLPGNFILNWKNLLFTVDLLSVENIQGEMVDTFIVDNFTVCFNSLWRVTRETDAKPNVEVYLDLDFGKDGYDFAPIKLI